MSPTIMIPKEKKNVALIKFEFPVPSGSSMDGRFLSISFLTRIKSLQWKLSEWKYYFLEKIANDKILKNLNANLQRGSKSIAFISSQKMALRGSKMSNPVGIHEVKRSQRHILVRPLDINATE